MTPLSTAGRFSFFLSAILSTRYGTVSAAVPIAATAMSHGTAAFALLPSMTERRQLGANTGAFRRSSSSSSLRRPRNTDRFFGGMPPRRGATNDDSSGGGESGGAWNRQPLDDVIRLRGPVATGYGRGGKKLGVPTANLPSVLFETALSTVPTGVYFGYAFIEGAAESEGTAKGGRDVLHKAVVNVGYSPTFEGQENKEKIVEAHLITKASNAIIDDDGRTTIDAEEDIEDDFYDEIMRLQLLGFIRPEKKFDRFPDLIAQIHDDVANAADALDVLPFLEFKGDDFFAARGASSWLGCGGGNDNASWEFELWDTAFGKAAAP